MASLMAWLSEPCDPQPFGDMMRPHGLPEHPTRLQVYAALMAMDRGGYGIIDGGGIYGRQGLEQREAYAYWDFHSFVRGWLMGTGDAEAGAVLMALKAEWARVEALASERVEMGAQQP